MPERGAALEPTPAPPAPPAPSAAAVALPRRMSAGRRLLLELSVGAVLGLVAWSFAGPSIIGWWYEPPSKDAFSCAGSVRTALAEFVKMQIAASLAGAAGLATLLFVGRRVFRPSGAAKA